MILQEGRNFGTLKARIEIQGDSEEIRTFNNNNLGKKRREKVSSNWNFISQIFRFFQ